MNDEIRLEGQTLGLSLTATDLQASLAWYRDVVGFAVERPYEREGRMFAVSLRSGNVRLLLTQDDGAKGDRVKGVGFSFQITTTQDVDAIAAGIKSRGGTLALEPTTNRFGARMMRLNDPDGFTLVISNDGQMRHEHTKALYGWITHTDLASANPAATKDWAGKVFGWTFRTTIPGPTGDIHLFSYSEKGGGAIRPNNPPEIPGSIPYIHVAETQASYDKAIAEGAEAMMSPTRVMEGVSVAIVRAPGGVPIGISGP